jgi:hypothetical protein
MDTVFQVKAQWRCQSDRDPGRTVHRRRKLLVADAAPQCVVVQDLMGAPIQLTGRSSAVVTATSTVFATCRCTELLSSSLLYDKFQ